MLWPGNALKDEYLYEQLVYTIGTEMNIHVKQRLYITKAMINNSDESDLTLISNGSIAEGIDLPGGDVVIMYIINKADVIENEQIIEHQIHHTTLVMELDSDHPGFAKLRLIVGEEQEYEVVTSKCCESKKKWFIFICAIISSLN